MRPAKPLRLPYHGVSTWCVIISFVEGRRNETSCLQPNPQKQKFVPPQIAEGVECGAVQLVDFLQLVSQAGCGL